MLDDRNSTASKTAGEEKCGRGGGAHARKRRSTSIGDRGKKNTAAEKSVPQLGHDLKRSGRRKCSSKKGEEILETGQAIMKEKLRESASL